MKHNVGSLIDRQVRRWELQRPRGSTQARPPCVAISRLPHSGGAALGKRVAELLDYGFFGSEILDEIARERGIQRELLAGVDERVHSTIERYVSDAFGARSFTESDYLRHVVRAIATLGNRGMAVILGRGAPFILVSERALRVLVVAPQAARLERLTVSRGIAPERAAARLAQEDERRRAFFAHQFGVTQEDPLFYDLVVNTGTLGIESAAHVVVGALRARFPPPSC